MTVPPLAIAAATIAICSGVADTSNWPMPDCPVCASSISSGKFDSACRSRSSR